MKNTRNVTDNTKNTKRRKYKKQNNIYESLYINVQITAVIIFILCAVILKGNDSSAFYSIKEDYKAFFATENIQYSNYSYNSFLNSILEDIQLKYDELMQVVNYHYGKGKGDLYPSNISFQIYTPEEKGVMPVKGIITSGFGIRKDPFDRNKKDFHTGLDIAAAEGTFIKSAFEGVVEETGYNATAGNFVRIKTGEQLKTFYCHSKFIFVKEGDKILKGQVIASVGKTGLVTGPHLHFEVLFNGDRVNPIYTLEQ